MRRLSTSKQLVSLSLLRRHIGDLLGSKLNWHLTHRPLVWLLGRLTLGLGVYLCWSIRSFIRVWTLEILSSCSRGWVRGGGRSVSLGRTASLLGGGRCRNLCGCFTRSGLLRLLECRLGVGGLGTRHCHRYVLLGNRLWSLDLLRDYLRSAAALHLLLLLLESLSLLLPPNQLLLLDLQSKLGQGRWFGVGEPRVPPQHLDVIRRNLDRLEC